MFNSLVRTDYVSQDTIVGGICVFLLVGLCFALIFILTTAFDPGAFVEGGRPIVRAASDSGAHATTLLYYSFVTLTTLGYGDIVPASAIARSLAATEALLGPLYVAVLVSALVGLHLSGRTSGSPRGEASEGIRSGSGSPGATSIAPASSASPSSSSSRCASFRAR